MKFNLLSAHQNLKDNHCKLTLDSNGSKIKDRSSRMMLFQGSVSQGFYPLHDLPSASHSPSTFFSTTAFLQLWHKRLCHPSFPMLRKILIINKLVFSGKQSSSFFCNDCAIGKNHKLPFTSSSSSVSHSLKLIHYDVWGPTPIPYVSSYKLYLLFVVEYTKYSWLFPLKAKSEVYNIFVNIKSYVENFVGNKIKILRLDSMGEFTSLTLNSFLLQHDIVHQYICPNTPEHNGCVEQKHRHLTEIARTLLIASKVPHNF